MKAGYKTAYKIGVGPKVKIKGDVIYMDEYPLLG
jgi:hypothetical protein